MSNSLTEWWRQIVPDLSRGHAQEWWDSWRAALCTPVPQRGKTPVSGWKLCMLLLFIIPWPSCWKETSCLCSLHVRYNHEGSSFLTMHHERWYENYLSTSELGSMQPSSQLPRCENLTLTAYDVSIWWVLKAARRLEHSSEAAGACQVQRPLDGRRRSADEPVFMEKKQHTPKRQFSLRKHRWYFEEGGDWAVERYDWCY